MQVSLLQRSQDSPLSKTEWRTNQDFNRTASSKQAVTVATPTVATISFVAATSSHDPNPILQSSDPDSDKTRSAGTAACKLRHQELTLGARTSLGCRNLLFLLFLAHPAFNIVTRPRTGVLVRRLLSKG